MALTKIKADGLTADLIDETKLADNSIDSEHYNDGSIDNAHLADNAVGTSEIADDAVTTDKLANAINTDIAAKAVLTGSTNNTITTVTGANAIQGEANLTYDGTALNVTGNSNIINSGGNAKLTLRRSNTASNTDDYGTIRFQSAAEDNNVVIGGARQSAENDGYLFISTSSSGTTSERLRILSNGHVAIGNDISNDTGMFKVIAADGQSDDQYVGQFKNSEATAGRNWGLLVQAGSNSSDESLRVRNSANNRDHLLVRGDGEVNIGDGNLVIETAGKGINFHPHSGTANLLDDYEEGSANATFVGAGGGSTSLSNAVRYTKIGNQVHMTFAANNFSNNGVGGVLEIGAPFAASDDFTICQWYGGDAYWYPSSVWDTYTDHCGFTPYIAAGASHIHLKVKRKDEDRQDDLSASNNGQISGATGLYLRFSLTYTAA